MRVWMDKDFIAYVDGQPIASTSIKVFLDGEFLGFCILADTEAGLVVCYRTRPKPHPDTGGLVVTAIDSLTGDKFVPLQIKYGKVEIKLGDG